MTAEEQIRLLVAAAERMHAAIEAGTPWAENTFPGQLPAPLQAIVDAGKQYDEILQQVLSARDNTKQTKEKPENSEEPKQLIPE